METPEHDYDDPAFDCNGEVDAILRQMTPEELEEHLSSGEKGRENKATS